jgi:hypothetical protein
MADTVGEHRLRLVVVGAAINMPVELTVTVLSGTNARPLSTGNGPVESGGDSDCNANVGVSSGSGLLRAASGNELSLDQVVDGDVRLT